MKKILIILFCFFSALIASGQSVPFTVDSLNDVPDLTFLGKDRYVWVAENGSFYSVSDTAENAVDGIASISIPGSSLFANIIGSVNISDNTLFVSPNGNNSSARKGDIHNTWADPYNAINDADPGDHIFVFKGSYIQANTTRSFQTVIATDSLSIFIEPGSYIETNGQWLLDANNITKLEWNAAGTTTKIDRTNVPGYGGACFQFYTRPTAKFKMTFGDVISTHNMDQFDARNFDNVEINFDNWEIIESATFYLQLGDGTVNENDTLKNSFIFNGRKLVYNSQKLPPNAVNVLYYGGAQEIANRVTQFNIDSILLYPVSAGGARAGGIWLNHSSHRYENVDVVFNCDYIEYEEPTGTVVGDQKAFIIETANSWNTLGTSAFYFNVKEFNLINGNIVDYDTDDLFIHWNGNITSTGDDLFEFKASGNSLIYNGHMQSLNSQKLINLTGLQDSIVLSGMLDSDATPIISNVAQNVYFRNLNNRVDITIDPDITFIEYPDYGAGYTLNTGSATNGYYAVWNSTTNRYDYTSGLVVTAFDSLTFSTDFVLDTLTDPNVALATGVGGIYGSSEGSGNGTIASGFTSVDFPNNAVINYRDEDDPNTYMRFRANADGSFATGTKSYKTGIEMRDATNGETFTIGVTTDNDVGITTNSIAATDMFFETEGQFSFNSNTRPETVELSSDGQGAMYAGFTNYDELRDSSLTPVAKVAEMINDSLSTLSGADGNGIFDSGTATIESSFQVETDNLIRTGTFGVATDYALWKLQGDGWVNTQGGILQVGATNDWYVYPNTANTGGSDSKAGISMAPGFPRLDLIADNGTLGSAGRDQVTRIAPSEFLVNLSSDVITGAVQLDANFTDGIRLQTSLANFTIGTGEPGSNQNVAKFDDNRAGALKTGIQYGNFGGDYSTLVDASLIPKALAASMISDSLSTITDSWLATELPTSDVSIDANGNSFEVEEASVVSFGTQDGANISANSDVIGLSSPNIDITSPFIDFLNPAFTGGGDQLLQVDNAGRLSATDGSAFTTWLKPELESGAVVIGANSNPFIINFMSTLQLSAGPNLEGGFVASANNTQVYGQDVIIRDTFIDNASPAIDYIAVFEGGTGKIKEWKDAANAAREWVETSATNGGFAGTYVFTFPINIPQDETELIVTYDDADAFGSYTISPGEYTITASNQITINNCCGFISQPTDRVYVKWLE